jgi:ketosteroid isomerase-like protein
MEPGKIVQSIYEAFGRGDMAAILAALDPAVVWVSHGQPPHPLAGEVRGPEAVGRWFGTLVQELDFRDFAIDRILTDGEVVVALGHETAEVRATGKSFTDSFVHVWTLSGGRVTRFDDFYDSAKLAAAATP